MKQLLNKDFLEFIDALNKAEVEYVLVGGYAVIIHGYIRSTGDMDVWVNKTEKNYEHLKVAYQVFGAPIFSVEEFMGNKIDVWSIGIEPNKIEVLSEVRGLNFAEAFKESNFLVQENIIIRYIGFNDLLRAKEAAGRFKDKNDIEQLKKIKS